MLALVYGRWKLRGEYYDSHYSRPCLPSYGHAFTLSPFWSTPHYAPLILPRRPRFYYFDFLMGQSQIENAVVFTFFL